MIEEIIVLENPERSLVGVLTHPDSHCFPEPRTAFILLNSGLLHRVGPNRISVALARSVAAEGFLSCRFDFSGIGDSPPARDVKDFEERACEDFRLVVDYLEREHSIGRVVVYGICSGAEAALAAGLRDNRVTACVLVNGTLIGREARIAAIPRTIARTKARYYAKRLFDWRSLVRFITFQSNYKQLVNTFKRLVLARPEDLGALSEPGPNSYLNRLADRDVKILMIYSEGSPALDFYRSFLEENVRQLQLSGKPVSVVTVPHADHVFTLTWSQQYLIEASRGWLASQCR